ncbi:MAG: hypothetical protein ABW046_11825 [Actinoplanes sp.]
MFRRRWPADRQRTRGIQFQGAPELLRLIQQLVRRPWRYGREHVLPIIRLIRPAPDGPDPLDGLVEWLRAAEIAPWARTGVRHAQRPASLRNPAGTVAGPPPSVEDLLDVAVKDLASHSGAGRRLKFPHYGLALWLTHLTPFTPRAVDREKEEIAGQLQIHLRQRLVNNSFTEGLADAVGDFPWWVRLTSRTAPQLGLAFMRGTWRPPRWFARHPLGDRGGFYALARKFAKPGFVDDHRNEIDRLLVDAFLQDLRVAYKRTGLFGSGRRRTAYPVLLVESEGEPADRLLQLVDAASSASRGRPRPRPRHEPLLVITDPVQPDPGGADAPADAGMAYRAWADRQLRLAQDRSTELALALPADTSRAGDWTALGQAGLPRRRRPWMTLALPVLLLAALAFVPWYNNDRCEAAWWPLTGRTLQREPLDGSRTQCIGLSNGRYRFFADPVDAEPAIAEQLRQVENGIAEINDEVVSNDRHVTVVYLSTLTNTTLGGYQAALEELRGLAVAQQDKKDSAVPIRLLLANGGDQMDHGGTAARLVAESAARERIVAVTGLGVSRSGTRDALKELDAAGIPTLGTLLSADELTRTVVSYHQVGPANSREAAVAAYYAKVGLKATEAAIYYSGDPADIYSRNLAEDVQKEFTARQIKADEITPYRTAADIGGYDVTTLGQQSCPARTGYLIFFAGRPDEFGQFLQGMKTTCPDRYPTILAGDAVTEFLSTGLSGYPGLPLYYMSHASSRVWGSDCSGIEQKVPFFAQYRAAGHGDACVNGQASRAMFGWDAMNTLWTAAVQVNGVNPGAAITPQAVLQGLNGLTGPTAVQGVTGTIDFSRGGASPQLPLNKAMLVLNAAPDGGTKLVLQCGTIATAQKPEEKCPTDGGK